jgi:hypothetical protein
MLFTSSGFIAECEERDRLIDLLDEALMVYSRLDAQLIGSMSWIQWTAYATARASVEAARQKVEEARQTLMQHRQDHGC